MNVLRFSTSYERRDQQALWGCLFFAFSSEQLPFITRRENEALHMGKGKLHHFSPESQSHDQHTVGKEQEKSEKAKIKGEMLMDVDDDKKIVAIC